MRFGSPKARRRMMPESQPLARMAAALILLCLGAASQDSPPGGTLRSYLQKIALQQLASREDRISAIRTREQFEIRRAEVRRQLLAMMGGLPEERSPLNLRK